MQVSAGIIRRHDGRILACQRGEGRTNAHLWEFPGGKQEAGETAVDCLKRELLEELALPVYNLRVAAENEAQGIRFTFLTGLTNSEPVPSEHEAICFSDPRQLLTLPFCPADTEIVQALALSAVRDWFWDFDGTLMDTYPMITATVLKACELRGFTADPGEVLAMLKVELPHCLRTLGEAHGFTAEEMRAAYEEALPLTEDCSLVKPVPGIPALLRCLQARGARHYIVTHRDRRTCEAMLRAGGLNGFFRDMVVQEDPLPRKPAPDRCQHLLRKYSLDPDRTAMVGDRPLDIGSGNAAGLLTVMLDTEGRFPHSGADITVSGAEALEKVIGLWQIAEVL